jgi:hypothetical protein
MEKIHPLNNRQTSQTAFLSPELIQGITRSVSEKLNNSFLKTQFCLKMGGDES